MTQKRLITDDTLTAFDGGIVEIAIREKIVKPLIVGEIPTITILPCTLGPFYHVDTDKYELRENGRLSINKAYLEYSRVEKLKEFAKSNEAMLQDMTGYLKFITDNECDVEMDASFSPMCKLLAFLKDDNRIRLLFKRIYMRTSRARWTGMDKPSDFIEADYLYNLKHLVERKENYYLYTFYIDATKLKTECNAPSLFCGKVFGGSSFQFKLNNHAIKYICGFKKVGNNWPSTYEKRKNIYLF